jgi:hypothetical protein
MSYYVVIKRRSQTHKLTNSQTHQFTNSPIHQFTSAWATARVAPTTYNSSPACRTDAMHRVSTNKFHQFTNR